MNLSFIVATLAATVAFAGVAEAEMRHRGHGNHWEQIDSNKDGNIEKSEFDGYRAERFKAADLNGDGKVSFEEAEAAREHRRLERRKELFAALDRDGDGGLSEAEMNRMAERMWIRTDLDDDDVVTPMEMREHREEMHKMWRERHGDRRHYRGGDGHRGPYMERN